MGEHDADQQFDEKTSQAFMKALLEDRALPSGPTVQDEMANAAFFVGLMIALPPEYGQIAERLSFDDAKENFFAAARNGLNAQLKWLDGKSISATSLIPADAKCQLNNTANGSQLST